MNVINMSFGFSAHSQAIQDVVDASYYQHDILLAAAAGNEAVLQVQEILWATLHNMIQLSQ